MGETVGTKDAYYVRLDEVFSKAASVYDRRILSNFVNVGIRAMEIAALRSVCQGAPRVLEIGCGTGEEAARILGATAARLVAVDVSHGMVACASEKMVARGLASRFEGRVMAASRIGSLGDSFDVVYSFNGALNTEPDLTSFFEGLRQITHQGSMIVLSLRNRFCLGEAFLYRLRGREGELAWRRGERVEVEVVGEKVESTYYGVREFLGMVPPAFLPVKIRGLAILLPPYLAEKVRSKILRRFLVLLDRALTGAPWLRTMGDETLYIFRRT